MIGLLIFGVAAGYVALWYYVFKTARNRGERVAAVLVAVLIPFWDLPIGYFEFQRHCSSEGGLRVYAQIKPQEKVYFESLPSIYPEEALKQGFKVVEMRRSDGKGVVRQELQDNKIIVRTVQTPESLIAISASRNERLAWNLYRDQSLAKSLSAKNVLATHTTFSWHGGWVQQVTWPFLRGSVDCFRGRTDPLVSLLLSGS